MLSVPIQLPERKGECVPSAGTHAQYNVEHGILHQSLKNKNRVKNFL